MNARPSTCATRLRPLPWIGMLLLAVACASSPPPPTATGALDWNAVADERVPQLVTRERDGSERVTKLWILVLDGAGYIRTGESRWMRNIQRDANVVLRIGGAAYPLRAVPVVDQALRKRIYEGFREKYGFQDFLVHPFGAGSANIMRLVEP